MLASALAQYSLSQINKIPPNKPVVEKLTTKLRFKSKNSKIFPRHKTYIYPNAVNEKGTNR
jgi:hypothetical protein